MATECVGTIASIGQCLVAPVGRQVGYLIDYKTNTENFIEKIRNLEVQIAETRRRVDEASRNLEIVSERVEQWLHEAEEAITNAKSLEEKINQFDRSGNRWCPNMKSLYSLSKQAKKKIGKMEVLITDGNFPQVSYPIPPSQIASSSSAPTGDAQGFESRRSIFNKVMKALTDDEINMVGIHGMGGVGKTTMAKEVEEKVKQDKLFKDVVFVVVSQNANLVNIQGEIAEQLRFKSLVEGNLHARANQLRARILRSEKLLIVLDDVWENLNLNEVGIPVENDQKSCKILLTSRNKDVCQGMNDQTLFPIPLLSDDEAWNLFKDKSGISDEAFLSTKKKVAKECACLPLAIVVVGSAIKNRDESSWEYFLRQLRKSIGKNIPGVDSKVYASLELSYNWLNEEVKQCFLLCSLFEEDFPIPIENLARYGFGLRLFEGIDSMDEARNRVKDAIGDLKRCHLLMDARKGDFLGIEHAMKGYVKMHDVIRDFAISIASRVEHSYMIASNGTFEWSKSENHTAISIHSKAMHLQELPDKLHCPKLRLLRLEGSYWPKSSTPDGFFERMENLEVLELRNMSFQSLPTSLGCLTKLRTLLFYFCKLPADMSIIGELKSLENLSFNYSDMVELPKEIGQLANLKVLEIFESNVIILAEDLLRLSKLEELYIPNGSEWKTVEKGKQITEQETIDKLKCFSNLQILKIWAGWDCPLDLVVSTSLKKFDISCSQKE